MNIYFFGGSFDPPHRGHFSIIQSCIKNTKKLVLIPAKQSPLKENVPQVSSYHRLQMLELLIKDLDSTVTIDNWETQGVKSNYTYDTIKYLQEKYPKSRLSMVIGGDQIENFDKWKNYKKILDMVQLIIFKRPNYKLNFLEGMKINWISNLEIDISSSIIRKKIANGVIPINDLNPKIINYIQDNNLYGYPI